MSDKLTCPLCGHTEMYTLIPHLRDEHNAEPDAIGRIGFLVPRQPLFARAKPRGRIPGRHTRNRVANAQVTGTKGVYL